MIFTFEGVQWWFPAKDWPTDTVAELPDGRCIAVTAWLKTTPMRVAVVSGEGKTRVKAVNPRISVGTAPKAEPPSAGNLKKLGPVAVEVSLETVITHTRRALYADLVAGYFPEAYWDKYTVKDYVLVGVVAPGRLLLEVTFGAKR